MRRFALFLLSLLDLCLADVFFTSPSPGEVFNADTAFSVSWVESGFSPPIADLTSYQLFLCAGGNDVASIIQLATITSDGSFPGSQITIEVSPEAGASEPQNA
jgi:hypothetical protein